MSRSTSHGNSGNRLATLAAIIALALVGYALWPFVGPPNGLGWLDFLQYYSGAKLFALGQNPYDQKLLLATENAVLGWQLQSPIVMWNPPLVLPLVLWLIPLNFHLAVLLWFMLSIGIFAWASVSCLQFSAQILSRKSPSLLQLFCLFSFYPFAASLTYGQISPVLLLAILGSYILLEKSKPLYAGAVFALTLIKPHLFIAVYVLSVFAYISGRDKRFFPGLLIGAAMLTALPMLWQPQILVWFAAAFSDPPNTWFTATASSWLQQWFPSLGFWSRLMFLPIAAAAAIHSVRQRVPVQDAIIVLLPLSFACAPYGWQYDQVALLPSLLLISAKLEPSTTTSARIGKLICVIAGLYQLLFHSAQQYAAMFPILFIAAYCCLKFSDSNCTLRAD